MKRITVQLVEDHTILREALRKMLELKGDLEVVGEADDGRFAVDLAKKLRPAVVLMDISMPRLNGLEATRQLLKAVPTIKVIILSAHNDDVSVERASECGASGFLTKQSSVSDICQAIREVNEGKTFFSPAISRRLEHLNSPLRDRGVGLLKKPARLTTREREVLQLVAEGKANKETAAELGICAKTVEKHRQNLMEKLKIHETAGLTRYALGMGIIESSAPSAPQWVLERPRLVHGENKVTGRG